MSLRISCPVCAGPVTVADAGDASCEVGHSFAPGELEARLGERASHALWAALRALEDQVSIARWRQQQHDAPAHVAAGARLAEEQARLLRRLLEGRDDEGAGAAVRSSG